MGNTFRLLGAGVLMPWKASSVMEERLRFVARLLDGEVMTDVGRIYRDYSGKWFWGLAYDYCKDRTPTHGWEASREAAMAAFAKTWRRE
jgi:hypothetical protein